MFLPLQIAMEDLLKTMESVEAHGGIMNFGWEDNAPLTPQDEPAEEVGWGSEDEQGEVVVIPVDVKPTEKETTTEEPAIGPDGLPVDWEIHLRDWMGVNDRHDNPQDACKAPSPASGSAHEGPAVPAESTASGSAEKKTCSATKDTPCSATCTATKASHAQARCF